MENYESTKTITIDGCEKYVHIRKNVYGAYVLSAEVAGYFINQTYYYYSKKEALKKFIADIKSQMGVM